MVPDAFCSHLLFFPEEGEPDSGRSLVHQDERLRSERSASKIQYKSCVFAIDKLSN